MKFRLPGFGEIKTGKDAVVEVVIKEAEDHAKKVEKSLLGGGFLDMPSSSTTKVSTKVLMANTGWVYRNNDVIAKEVATIEFELYSIKVVGKEIVYNPITSHPILDALDRFNSFTAASDGFYVTQSHKKLAGNAYWLIEGSGPNVTNIYVLPPDKITPKVSKVEGSQASIASYDYQDTIEGMAVKESYKPEQIIHFKVPNPNNYLKGIGAVEAAAADIDMDNLAIEANMQLFKRGLIANFILSTEKSLTPEQLKQLRSEFKSAYTGIQNAFKVPILSGGLKPENIQMTNKDMEFIAQQEWVRDKITSIFGNSKAVLGVTDDVNRANAESTIMNWKRTTIRSEMKGITDTLNEFFVPRFGTNLVIGFCDPVEEDEQAKIADVAGMINSNVITPNEAREILGYDPLPDADTLRDNLGLPQIPAVPKSLMYINREKVLRKSGVYKKIEKYIEVRKVTDKVARQKVMDKLAAKQKANPKEIDSYYEKQISLVDAAEHIFEQKVLKFIDKLVTKAVSEVPAEIHNMQSKALFDEEEILIEAQLDFTPILTELAAASGNTALNLINSGKVYSTTNIRKLIEQRVNLFATSMVQTDKDKIIDIIANGVREGSSVPEIRNQITQTFESYSKAQAQRITRTEVLRVSNQASLDAWDQSGIVEGKQWLTAGDPDAECAVYEGQIVYDLGGSFYEGSNEFEDGDPPLHPNCRCVVIPVLSSDKGLSSDQIKILALSSKVKEMKLDAESMDKRTKTYKTKIKELELYTQQLEDYLDEDKA